MVGISLLTLVPGVSGGSETYSRELIRALARIGTLEYTVYLPTIAPDAAEGLPARTVTAYRAGRTIPSRIAAMTLATVAPGGIRRQLELDSLDAIHFPLSVMIPRVDRPAAAATIHDVQHEYFPGHFPRQELAYRRLVYGWTARRSPIVITGSEHIAETLVERLGVPPERIRVIPHGVDHDRFRPPDGTQARQKFLLYPANRWPHKNHERLFAALALLRRRRPALRLVLTGTGHNGIALPEGVVSEGRVSAERLAELYRSASALVFPSLYEGFGLPALEAMASGCPVAVSDLPVLHEVCLDAARTFDPTSAADIARAVDELLDDPAYLVERGLQRAASFAWEKSARRHEQVYRELAEG